ncbi:unnamed protein product [Clavelina lepadiformis]|uniref:Secreted protein n=1 Tax=Clavelina lepadiformis TaxID=159417 RepID=A0ABP0F3F0_CLALP
MRSTPGSNDTLLLIAAIIPSAEVARDRCDDQNFASSFLTFPARYSASFTCRHDDATNITRKHCDVTSCLFVNGGNPYFNWTSVGSKVTLDLQVGVRVKSGQMKESIPRRRCRPAQTPPTDLRQTR